MKLVDHIRKLQEDAIKSGINAEIYYNAIVGKMEEASKEGKDQIPLSWAGLRIIRPSEEQIEKVKERLIEEGFTLWTECTNITYVSWKKVGE